LRRCRWFSFRQPPALPRTSLAASPPEPVTSNSPRLPCRAALPTGLPLACAFSRPFDPASNRVCTRPSQARPPNLIVCPCPPALPSDQPQLAPSASPPALPRIRTSTCVAPNSSGLAYDFFSSARSPAAVAAGLAPNPPGLAFRTSPCGRPSSFALRLSFRSRLAPFASAQPSGRLPACALTPACAFVSCLPSSQPSGRLSQGFGSRLAPRSRVSPLAMPSG